MYRKLALTVVLYLTANGFAEPKVEHHPIQIAALQEMGMVEQGLIGGNVLEEFRSEWVDHFGAFITKRITVDERLNITAGLGGIFQFRKPEKMIGSFPGSQRKTFFIGPTASEAVYSFGDVNNPIFKLGAGVFGYKYNPDASNLGEYLFRTIPYPSTIFTGGYGIVNGAGGYLQGLKAMTSLGNFKWDVFFLTETSMAPLYDGSIASVASYSLGDGMLEMGGGLYFKRLLPVKPSRTARQNVANAYMYMDQNKAISADYNVYANRKTFWEKKLAWALANGNVDSIRIKNSLVETNSIIQFIDSVNLKPENQRPALHYFTASGLLAMARISLDLKKIFGDDFFEPSALRLYSEVAVLGWKNYPVFYENRSERIPIMVGFNVPTFKLLDVFAVQTEFFKSSHLNNTFPIGSDGNNVPFVPDGSDSLASKNSYNDLANRDNWKWSVLLKKNIHSNITASAQFANDHLRLTDANFYYGPQFNPNEITVSKKDWYWMLQLSWGI